MDASLGSRPQVLRDLAVAVATVSMLLSMAVAVMARLCKQVYNSPGGGGG